MSQGARSRKYRQHPAAPHPHPRPHAVHFPRCISSLTLPGPHSPPQSTGRCSYSEQLQKWIEVGNSGMFRPEMLRPMGLPEGVNVIAWGLGLER